MAETVLSLPFLKEQNRMSENKKKKVKYIDDGRTIANMNVEGMPWYNPAKASDIVDDVNLSENSAKSRDLVNPEPLGFKETVAMTKGVLAAALLIGGIFVIIFLLFILFCVYVWF